jgi:flavodoxin
MKSAVVYYSYSGNTKKVAQELTNYLKQAGEVEMIELVPQDEPRSFFGQCRRAFWHSKARLESMNTNLLPYDIICFGTPVWAFGPAPAINTYLDECSGLCEKTAILFTTYGSGTGNDRCLTYMQGILAKKGIQDFKKFSIQQYKVDNPEFVQSVIKEALK